MMCTLNCCQIFAETGLCHAQAIRCLPFFDKIHQLRTCPCGYTLSHGNNQPIFLAKKLDINRLVNKKSGQHISHTMVGYDRPCLFYYSNDSELLAIHETPQNNGLGQPIIVDLETGKRFVVTVTAEFIPVLPPES